MPEIGLPNFDQSGGYTPVPGYPNTVIDAAGRMYEYERKLNDQYNYETTIERLTTTEENRIRRELGLSEIGGSGSGSSRPSDFQLKEIGGGYFNYNPNTGQLLPIPGFEPQGSGQYYGFATPEQAQAFAQQMASATPEERARLISIAHEMQTAGTTSLDYAAMQLDQQQLEQAARRDAANLGFDYDQLNQRERESLRENSFAYAQLNSNTALDYAQLNANQQLGYAQLNQQAQNQAGNLAFDYASLNQREGESIRNLGFNYDQLEAQIAQDAAQMGFNYAQLNAQERESLRNLAATYFNITADANATRQQVLATLIQGKQNAAVDLAQLANQQAETASQFAANPRNWTAFNNYMTATGGSTPFGDTSGQAFQDYQGGLQDTFNQIFGNQQDMNRAREFLQAPIPQEYLTPLQAPQVPQAQQIQPPQVPGAAPGSSFQRPNLQPTQFTPPQMAVPQFTPPTITPPAPIQPPQIGGGTYGPSAQTGGMPGTSIGGTGTIGSQPPVTSLPNQGLPAGTNPVYIGATNLTGNVTSGFGPNMDPNNLVMRRAANGTWQIDTNQSPLQTGSVVYENGSWRPMTQADLAAYRTQQQQMILGGMGTDYASVQNPTQQGIVDAGRTGIANALLDNGGTLGAPGSLSTGVPALSAEYLQSVGQTGVQSAQQQYWAGIADQYYQSDLANAQRGLKFVMKNDVGQMVPLSDPTPYYDRRQSIPGYTGPISTSLPGMTSIQPTSITPLPSGVGSSIPQTTFTGSTAPISSSTTIQPTQITPLPTTTAPSPTPTAPAPTTTTASTMPTSFNFGDTKVEGGKGYVYYGTNLGWQPNSTALTNPMYSFAEGGAVNIYPRRRRPARPDFGLYGGLRDMNRDGVVNSIDQGLYARKFGQPFQPRSIPGVGSRPPTPPNDFPANSRSVYGDLTDLNNDGVVNSIDQALRARSQRGLQPLPSDVGRNVPQPSPTGWNQITNDRITPLRLPSASPVGGGVYEGSLPQPGEPGYVTPMPNPDFQQPLRALPTGIGSNVPEVAPSSSWNQIANDRTAPLRLPSRTTPEGNGTFEGSLPKPGEPGYVTPMPYAKGGKIDFESIWDSRGRDGFSPPSSEGGTNLNIHERAVILGESGQVYGTLGERRPDGSPRAEQLIIKPLPSEVKKDKALEDQEKQSVESMKQTMKAFAEGGTVTAGQQFTQSLRDRLRALAPNAQFPAEGLPYLNALAPLYGRFRNDDDLYNLVKGGYSAQGIPDATLDYTLQRLQPRAMGGVSVRYAR